MAAGVVVVASGVVVDAAGVVVVAAGVVVAAVARDNKNCASQNVTLPIHELKQVVKLSTGSTNICYIDLIQALHGMQCGAARSQLVYRHLSY